MARGSRTPASAAAASAQPRGSSRDEAIVEARAHLDAAYRDLCLLRASERSQPALTALYDFHAATPDSRGRAKETLEARDQEIEEELAAIRARRITKNNPQEGTNREKTLLGTLLQCRSLQAAMGFPTTEPVDQKALGIAQRRMVRFEEQLRASAFDDQVEKAIREGKIDWLRALAVAYFGDSEAWDATIDEREVELARIALEHDARVACVPSGIWESLSEGVFSELARMERAERSFGDEAESVLHREEHRPHWFGWQPTATSARQARARAQGLLRNPYMMMGGEPRKAGTVLQAIVEVDHPTLRRLLREDPALELGGFIAGGGAGGRTGRPSPGLTGHSRANLYACARKAAQVPEMGEVEVRFILDAGSFRGRPDDSMSEAVQALGFDVPVSWSELAVKEDRTRGLFSLRQVESDRPDSEPASRTSFLGPDSCRHENAQWRESGHQTALLSCPDCLRLRLRAEPLHRLPDDLRIVAHSSESGTGTTSVADALERRRHYCERVVLAARLRGEESSETLTIAQLRARDGVIDPRPSPRVQVDVPARAGARGSVRDLLNSRSR